MSQIYLYTAATAAAANRRRFPSSSLSARYSTDTFKKIDPSRLRSALPAPSKPSMDHPAVRERLLAPSLQAHSGRQLVGSCRFSSKLHKQSKLEVQPSLEAKPM